MMGDSPNPRAATAAAIAVVDPLTNGPNFICNRCCRNQVKRSASGVESPDGYTLTPYQQDFEEQVDAASKLMKRYKNTLRELAK